MDINFFLATNSLLTFISIKLTMHFITIENQIPTSLLNEVIESYKYYSLRLRYVNYELTFSEVGKYG